MLKNDKTKRELFFDSLIQSAQDNDQKMVRNLFTKDQIIKFQNIEENDYRQYSRIMSTEEQQVITKNAFELLLFWVNSHEIDIDFFERFLSILLSYKNRLTYPIPEHDIISIIEMISMIEFRDYVIYPALEIYLTAPNNFMEKSRKQKKLTTTN